MNKDYGMYYCGNDTCIYCEDDGYCSNGCDEPEFCDDYTNIEEEGE